MQRKFIFLDEMEVKREQNKKEILRFETLGRLKEEGPLIQDYTEAFELYTQAIELGSTRSMVRLGLMYAWGRGVEKDAKKAVELLEQASEWEEMAVCLLGLFYAQGYGVKKDLQQAEKLFLGVKGPLHKFAEDLYKAVLEDNAESAFRIGLSFITEKSYKNDLSFAVQWFKKAAEGGHTRAMKELGSIYDKKYSWDTDMVLFSDRLIATEWYRKAAEAGDKEACLRMALRYEYGWGTKQDLQEAERWRKKGESLCTSK